MTTSSEPGPPLRDLLTEIRYLYGSTGPSTEDSPHYQELWHMAAERVAPYVLAAAAGYARQRHITALSPEDALGRSFERFVSWLVVAPHIPIPDTDRAVLDQVRDWAFQALNTAARAEKRRHPNTPIHAAEPAGRDPSPGHTIEIADQLDFAARRIRAELGATAADCFLLRAQGRVVRAIALELGISRSTAARLLADALDLARRLLTPP